MRVITGTARSVRLKTPDGSEVRPTAERVKEAVFSMIQFDIEGRRVLDLFAGSGQMGIEALSRGAEKAFFIDFYAPSIKAIKDNLEKTKLLEKAEVIFGDSIAFIRSTNEKFDIAFVDPPYSKGLYDDCLAALVNKMNDGGTIICECPSKDKLLQSCGDFSIVKESAYSSTKIVVYRKK